MGFNESVLTNLAKAQAAGRSAHKFYDPSEVGGEDALFGAFKPSYIMATERPEQRQVVELKTRGLTNKEIAEATGYSRASVNTILHQPWAQERMVKKLEQSTMQAVKDMIEQTAGQSIVRLAEMAGDENLKFKHPKLFTEINQSFVDRFMGKAPIIVESKEPTKLTDEELANDIARLRQEVGASPETGDGTTS